MHLGVLYVAQAQFQACLKRSCASYQYMGPGTETPKRDYLGLLPGHFISRKRRVETLHAIPSFCRESSWEKSFAECRVLCSCKMGCYIPFIMYPLSLPEGGSYTKSCLFLQQLHKGFSAYFLFLRDRGRSDVNSFAVGDLY